jgi:serine/threonine protein kinase
VTHPNIVPCLAADVKSKTPAFIMPLYGHGSLLKVIQEEKTMISDALVLKIALDIATAFELLHSIGIWHRDLTLGNIMVHDYSLYCITWL